MKLADKSANQITFFEHLILALAKNSNMVDKPYFSKKEGMVIYEQNALRIINQAEAILAELDRRNANT